MVVRSDGSGHPHFQRGGPVLNAVTCTLLPWTPPGDFCPGNEEDRCPAGPPGGEGSGGGSQQLGQAPSSPERGSVMHPDWGEGRGCDCVCQEAVPSAGVRADKGSDIWQ